MPKAFMGTSLIAAPRSSGGWPKPTPSPMPSGQESPKGGVGSPTGFARGAGRAPQGTRAPQRALPVGRGGEWALPVMEIETRTPETTNEPKAGGFDCRI